MATAHTDRKIFQLSPELHDFFMQAPVPMCILMGPEHVFTVANSLYLELIGRDPIGKPVREVFSPEEGGNYFSLLDDVYETGVSYTGKELHFSRMGPDGTKEFRLNIGYHPYRDIEGRMQGVLAFVQDVTEQVMAREAIEAQQKWLETVMNRLPTSILFLNSETGRSTFANQAAQKMIAASYVGQMPEERYGHEIIATDLQGRVLQSHEVPSARAARGETIQGEELILKSPAGNFHISATAEQIPASYGQAPTTLLVLQDLTATKSAEAALRESEEQFRTLADSMPQIIFVANENGDITYFNKRWYEYISPEVGETTGWAWKNQPIHHPDDLQKAIDTWTHSVQTGSPYEIEYRLRRGSDGQYRWHLGRALPIRDASGKITKWYGTNTDIHEYKTLLETLEQTQQAAEAANAAKTVFLANMSHEIRTPLGAIMGFVDLMKHAGTERAEFSEYLSVIERNSGQLMRIIDDILDLSKVEAGKMLIENVEFSLSELLADLSSLMGLRARENSIHFELRAASNLPDKVISDPVRVRQILTNVVGNAIKFTEKGQVILEVTSQGSMLEFKVTDTGCGISEEQAQHLFQPFAQADVSTTRKYGGTGLGLVLTKRLSEALGGSFKLASSAPGKGSVFVATIAVKIPHASMSVVPRLHGALLRPAMEGLNQADLLSGMKVLLVEDSPDNQFLVGMYLQKTGAEVSIASNGREGIDHALNREFDVVLMDIQMPHMDGHEAARLLRSKQYQKPIIALTAHAMKEERERTEASGFNDFLPKPIIKQHLIEKLHLYKSQMSSDLRNH